MKTENLVIGSLVLLFALILFGDALYATFYPANMLISSNDAKGIAGFVFIMISILILIKARK